MMMGTQFYILFVCRLYLLQIGQRCMSSVCLHLGIDNSAASSIAFVMLASLVSIYVHSMLVVSCRNAFLGKFPSLRAV